MRSFRFQRTSCAPAPSRSSLGCKVCRCKCGGTLPKSIIPSITLDILPENCAVEKFGQMLRRGNPPIISYIGDKRLKLDLRTIFSHQDDLVVDAIRTAATTR
ncbi:MAG: hypothetical protein DME57_01230 [Verrucomicrobia bacterium]|nr:MAG: hypothetical protein DME57_01230 [Verrucomicrobiota bacterium]